MEKQYLLFLPFLLSLAPFIGLAALYDRIPEEIPAFTDLAGKPVFLLQKDLVSVFRLPLMGVMIQVITLTMSSLDLPRKKENNRTLWLAVSFFAALKMGLTSIEVLTYTEPEALSLLRAGVLMTILISVAFILLSIGSLYKEYSKQPGKYVSAMRRSEATAMGMALFVYIFLVFLPFLL